MGLNSGFTQLDLLDEPTLEVLRRSWITTLEEFVGVIEADPEGIRELLNTSGTDFEELKNKALSLLDPKVRDAFERQKGRKYPLGALDPSLRRRNP